jgi:hypothetical protein
MDRKDTIMTPTLDSPSRKFAYWDYAAETRELVHPGSGHRIALEVVLTCSDQMLRCIFEVHDKPWGDAKVLDELVELLGTHFKGERLLRPVLAQV